MNGTPHSTIPHARGDAAHVGSQHMAVMRHGVQELPVEERP